MPNKKISVRPLEPRDFSFVRKLAAKQPNFTIPPPYVLWLLTRIKNDVCLIAEDSRDPLAYLLSAPMEKPASSIYVWQLASTGSGRDRGAVMSLLLELKRKAKKMKSKRIFFSALPGTATFRRIRRYISIVWQTTPQPTVKLLPDIAPDETEYQIVIR